MLRMFADAYGVTPAVYAQRCRLLYAQQLLVAGVHLAAAARRAGYTSAATLCRALRRSRQGAGAAKETGGSGSDRSWTSV